jgi:lipoprotein-releasing system permease protein
MKVAVIFEISLALLMARWKQTLVAALGVTFGITMFITLLSFMAGLNTMLDGLIGNRTAHIRLYNEIQASKFQPIDLDARFSGGYHFIRSIKPKNELLEIHNNISITNTLKKDNRVLGVAPKIIAQVFYNVGDINLTGIIDGIDVEAESKWYFFNDYLIEGNAIDLKNVPNSIILGKGAALKMLVNLGDVIQVTTPNNDQVQLKVVGMFQTGVVELDKVQSYTSIATAQKLLGESSSYITDLQVKLKDLKLAPSIAKEYRNLFEIDAMDIQAANAQFETGSNVRSLISYSVGITLLIVAGFGIYNILNMMIYEKMDSIAILKATGFSGNDVKFIFIAIALSIGIFGGLLGLLCGFGLSAVIHTIPFMSGALPMVKTYPMDYSLKFYFIAISFSIITTYLAGFFPSEKASKVDPVIIIRGK